jgi:hypothetical protein
LSLRREGDSNPRSAVRRTTVFETAAFDHSAISPYSLKRWPKIINNLMKPLRDLKLLKSKIVNPCSIFIFKLLKSKIIVPCSIFNQYINDLRTRINDFRFKKIIATTISLPVMLKYTKPLFHRASP